MWDETPSVEAILATATAQLRAVDAQGARTYIMDRLLRHGGRRPHSWEEFIQARPDRPEPRPIVYDRPSKLFFVGGHADHDRLCAELFHFRQLKPAGAVDWDDFWGDAIDYDRHDWAADYITTGMGLRQGSPSAWSGRRELMIGDGIKLTAQERAVFRDYTFSVLR